MKTKYSIVIHRHIRVTHQVVAPKERQSKLQLLIKKRNNGVSVTEKMVASAMLQDISLFVDISLESRKKVTEDPVNCDSKANSRCMLCGVYFTDDHQLLLHQQSHHVGKINGFNCIDCGRSFQWERDLARHRRVHGVDRLDLVEEENYAGDQDGKNMEAEKDTNWDEDTVLTISDIDRVILKRLYPVVSSLT